MKLLRVLQDIFGSTAGTEEREVIGSFADGNVVYTTDPTEMQSLGLFKKGLFGICVGENSPVIEDMNSLYYLLTYQLAYILQSGIPEYDPGEIYYIGSKVNVGGVVYTSLTNDNTANPVTDETKWKDQAPNFDAALINGRIISLKKYEGIFSFYNATDNNWSALPSALKVSPNQEFVAFANASSGSGLYVLNTNDAFPGSGTAATISAQPTGVINDIAFSPDGRFLSCALGATPWIENYEINGKTFTKLANPAALPGSGVARGVAWSRDGQMLAVVGDTFKVAVYVKSGSTFLKLTSPTTFPATDSDACCFSPDGKYLCVTNRGTSLVDVYLINPPTPGTFVFQPTFTLLTNAFVGGTDRGRCIRWHPSGAYFIVINGGATSTINAFKIIGTAVTNIVQAGLSGVGFATMAEFTPDGRHLYVATRGNIPSGANNVRSFKVTGEQFVYAGNVINTNNNNVNTLFALDQSNNYLFYITADSVINPYPIQYHKNPVEILAAGKSPKVMYEYSKLPLW